MLKKHFFVRNYTIKHFVSRSEILKMDIPCCCEIQTFVTTKKLKIIRLKFHFPKIDKNDLIISKLINQVNFQKIWLDSRLHQCNLIQSDAVATRAEGL